MKINTPEYQAWLDSIEPGQQVAYSAATDVPDNWGPNAFWQIVTISRVTPTRHFRNGEAKISRSGRYEPVYGGYYIHPVTEEIREKVYRRELIREIRDIQNLHALPTSVLSQVARLCQPDKEVEL